MLDLSAAFAVDYTNARAKFVESARACSLDVERHVHPSARGVQDEELSIDVALLGDARASGLLLVTSGIHGVEGFCGSGCQVALLRDPLVATTLEATESALLLCHAVNPYGFSHLRRVNEDNVDLNRNFRDFAAPASRNDAYAELHPTIVPDAWPPTPENSASLAQYIARFGIPAVQSALTRGQTDFPDGLFYAGRAPAWSNGILRDVLSRYARDRARLGWIDLHTGLGPWAHGEKIHLGPDERAMIARTRSWFGGDVTTVYDGTATSAELTGVCYHAALDACPGVEYTGITLEFGTRPLAEVLLALRAEQWLANHPHTGALLRDAIKRQMREAFYDDSFTWQAMAYAQSRVAVLQALRGLAS